MALLSVLIMLASSSCSGQREDEGLKVKELPKAVEVKHKKPLKISLKRTAEGKYVYEISGDDPEEIIKADLKLKKHLRARE